MKFFTLLISVITFVSCHSTSKSSGMTSEQLTNIVCKCAQPIVTYNNELRSLAETDNMGQLTQEMAKGDAIMQSAEACITDKILTDIDQILSPNLNQQIIDHCKLDPRMIDDILIKLQAFNRSTFK